MTDTPMPDPPETNGRATIREVHSLLNEMRREQEGHLENMERRLTNALIDSEGRITKAVIGLESRVIVLEQWRAERDEAHRLELVRHDARVSPVLRAAYWAEEHWRLITVICAIFAAIFVFLLDTSVDIHPSS